MGHLQSTMTSDISRRSKLIQTFWLFWAFNHRGIHNCILGPTLLDLQLLLQKDLNALSYLFFASGLGSMLGSLAAGFLASRFDLRLQLCLSLMVGSVSVAAIPQVHHLSYTYIVVFVFGITRGLVVCFVMQICGDLWEKKGPPFQFVACGTSTGAIIAPIIAKPFLCPYNTVPLESSSKMIAPTDTPLNHTLAVYVGNSTRTLSDFIITEHTKDIGTVCTAEDTRVQWAFFVLGCCMLPAGVSQLYYWLVYRSEGTKQETKSSEYTGLNHNELSKLKPIFVVFYVNLFVMYFFSSSLPATYSAILTVYGVRGPLHMPKSDMVIMTSLFWMGSLSGKIASVFLSRQLSNFNVIASHLSGLVLVGIIFISLGNRYPVALWLLSVTVGYFSGPYIGGVLAWVTDLTSLHPKITSLCFLASGGGAMIFPFVGGILYNNFEAQSYLYLIFSIIIAMGTAFSCITAISKALPPALN